MGDLRLARHRHCARRGLPCDGLRAWSCLNWRASLRWTHGWARLKARPTRCRVPDLQAQKGILTAETLEVQWSGNDATLGLRNVDFIQALRGGRVGRRVGHRSPRVACRSVDHVAELRGAKRRGGPVASGVSVGRQPGLRPAVVGGAGMHGRSNPSQGATRQMHTPQRGPSRA